MEQIKKEMIKDAEIIDPFAINETIKHSWTSQGDKIYSPTVEDKDGWGIWFEISEPLEHGTIQITKHESDGRQHDQTGSSIKEMIQILKL